MADDEQAMAARLKHDALWQESLGIADAILVRQRHLNPACVEEIAQPIFLLLRTHVETLQQSLAAATTERERLTQEVERLKAAEFYTQYARAEKAEAQRDAAHEALREYQDAYVKAVEANTYSNGEMKHRDHACAECGPVVEGWESRKFVCRYHKAKAALQSVPNQQGHVSEQVLDPTGMFPIKRVPKETK